MKSAFIIIVIMALTITTVATKNALPDPLRVLSPSIRYEHPIGIGVAGIKHTINVNISTANSDKNKLMQCKSLLKHRKLVVLYNTTNNI
ncbi:hypothetical protein [Lonomia obliqua multiple nucleopolyhedrovirus]|uniref:Uncharacterized protein n=1 Tax=Lonomia obliqua multiple nucleopolyhedrovirus TaxID=134394 RepID=A0A126FC42_9ABAC|nr:hypothetical protein [Lonomia obliqua multiple nucleopolyhedrovirus]AKN80959.1 hypothetical protein [Lonomia obliqua multiple nucleopolyhedrovirus]